MSRFQGAERQIGKLVLALLVLLSCRATCFAQTEFNTPPISYESTEPADSVYELGKKLRAGQIELEWDENHGWLPALLKSLDVSPSSQTLVFSKTSRQLQKISPSRPRALYFNDDVYIGWVQNGDFVEIAAVDPQQGANFYTVDQHNSSQPVITRDSSQCLTCHATSKTQKVPGFLVRSVFPKRDGHPEYRLGTTFTDHRTSFKERFGGWYVTGTHGEMQHRGNVTLVGTTRNSLDREAGANLDQLPGNVRATAYLSPGSDIVALMILEHQTQMHNWVTRASYTYRQTIHYQAEMNRLFERDADYEDASTARRINTAAEDLVRYLFFSGEYQLTSAVHGSSRFSTEFMSIGPRDSKGRSLRQLDLDKRLLKYPCSYLIYSESFLALPKPILDQVKKRMLQVLSGEDQSEPFSHLSVDDRRNILEILCETHPLFQTVQNVQNGDRHNK